MTLAARTVLLVMLVAVSPFSLSSGSAHENATKSKVPLSADELAVYKLILQKRSSHEGIALNVSAKTFPLNVSNPVNGWSNNNCLEGIQLEVLTSVAHSYHELPPDVLPSKGMKLVDPDKQAKIVHGNDPSRTTGKGKSVETAVTQAFQTALFSMSEIAFDKEHRYAAVSYHFWCGGLCGNGASVVLEKVAGEWKTTDRVCASWIS